MSQGGNSQSISRHDQVLFWGCFIALVTTAFGFITRVFLIDTWGRQFGLDEPQKGELLGIGIWPFAVSIIGFSLIIDRIGYKTAMILAFLGHMTWAVLGVAAFFVSQDTAAVAAQGGIHSTGYQMLYWGSLILGLANGTVESFINPVVATMFSREKTKWLNILHAGWPGGLVIAGAVTIFIDQVPWWVKVGILAVPAVVYFVMLIPLKFPIQEREAAGVSYREMLAEFGILGASVASFLITLQLIQFFQKAPQTPFIILGIAMVAAFGAYTQSLGRILMFVLVLIMMPLATTEIGTDGWITDIMKGVAGESFHSGWILVYTSAIMMVLRFFAGPIVHTLSPLGLLAVSSLLAIIGLLSLSFTAGMAIFVAATLYGFGKTFFWPTMLGVVSEQMPKGGALTLNAISGIGMLAVGTLGTPFLGALQSNRQIEVLQASEFAQQVPGLLEGGKLTVVDNRSIYAIIKYQAIDEKKLNELLEKGADTPERKQQWQATLDKLMTQGKQRALADIAVFPAIMLAGYLGLILYFKSKGGYRAEVLVGHQAVDEQFTGGVHGAVE
ncbi:MAG: MFS transporter [Pirellulaceae bacterium]|nr:MAG: MFS transporter [Pirellulaceae bacterium]